MARPRSFTRGNALIEFTLVGIPLIFVMISVFELSRGMWMYHTLSTAVREGTRFAAVRANNCNVPPSNCAVTIRAIAQRINDYAVGMPATELRNVRFSSRTRTVQCSTLAACLGSGGAGSTYWPAAAPGATIDLGGESMAGYVEIRAEYEFRSAIAMFWPGAGPGQVFGAFLFPASSRENIQF